MQSQLDMTTFCLFIHIIIRLISIGTERIEDTMARKMSQLITIPEEREPIYSVTISNQEDRQADGSFNSGDGRKWFSISKPKENHTNLNWHFPLVQNSQLYPPISTLHEHYRKIRSEDLSSITAFFHNLNQQIYYRLNSITRLELDMLTSFKEKKMIVNRFNFKPMQFCNPLITKDWLMTQLNILHTMISDFFAKYLIKDLKIPETFMTVLDSPYRDSGSHIIRFIDGFIMEGKSEYISSLAAPDVCIMREKDALYRRKLFDGLQMLDLQPIMSPLHFILQLMLPVAAPSTKIFYIERFPISALLFDRDLDDKFLYTTLACYSVLLNAPTVYFELNFCVNTELTRPDRLTRMFEMQRIHSTTDYLREMRQYYLNYLITLEHNMDKNVLFYFKDYLTALGIESIPGSPPGAHRVFVTQDKFCDFYRTFFLTEVAALKQKEKEQDIQSFNNLLAEDWIAIGQDNGLDMKELAQQYVKRKRSITSSIWRA